MDNSVFPKLIWISFLISAVCSAFISKFGHKIAAVDEPNERSSHLLPTPRGGGIGIWLAFILAGFFIIKNTGFVLIASTAGLLGFFEDRFSLPSKFRLAIQFVISTAVIWLLAGFPVSTLSAALFLFWVIFVTGTSNFYNFMDGINGIAGLSGAVGFGLLSYFAFFMSNEPEIALMSASLASACLGFLPFNILRAKVFMGDVGSIFLGFVFGSFVIKLSVDISVFLCLVMFLNMFYADAVVTILVRWSRGENLMKAHRRHLYQYLSNELRLQHWVVSGIYAVVQAAFGLFALSAYSKGLGWQLAVFGIFSIMFLVSYKIIKGISSIAGETRIN